MRTAASRRDAPVGAEPLTQYVQRVLTRARAFDRRHPRVWDLPLTGAAVIAAVVDYTSGGWTYIAENDTLPGWLILGLSLGFSVPLLWRRTHPVPVLLSMVPVALVNSATGALLQASLLLLVALFNAALRVRMGTLLWLYGLLLTPSVVAAARYPAEQGWDQTLVPAAMSLALAAMSGIVVRARQDHLASLVERARRLEVERDQQARLATAAERARIAREMHDIIGHNLSVITGLADGGRYAAAKSPERASQALNAIATTSRQALTELRRLLDVLADDEPPRPDLTPQPTLTDLTALIEGVREAGLPVHTTVKGTPTSTPGRQLTIYRVIQEALTNTLKHAGPQATSHIEISYGEGGAVSATVTDTGRGATLNGTEGRGLPGMRERTALYDGTLEAGPDPQGGWRVHLELPEESTP
ncbi:sensor histidine kinase [Streptomyces sp. NPDC003635]